MRAGHSLKMAFLLCAVVVPAVQAQFIFTTNSGALTISGYTGPGGDVIIPDTTNGMPVTSIGSSAFTNGTTVTSVTIPNSITNIGNSAFSSCTLLASVTIGTNVANIPDQAFISCTSLTNITIPNSVTSIGVGAFVGCTNLINVRIGSGVTYVGHVAFGSCYSLTTVYCLGNAPSYGVDVFVADDSATIYYLPGTTGWGAMFAGRPTALWEPQVLTDDERFGVRTNQFGFNISWAGGMAVAVDACTNSANPVWTPLQTNTLTADTLYFSDAERTNYPARFYRLRWP